MIAALPASGGERVMIRFDKVLTHVEIPGSFAVLAPRNDGMSQESAMVRRNEIREGEVAVTPPAPTDAGLTYIGRIHTPWTDRMMTSRQGRQDRSECRIEIFEPGVPAL